MALSDKHRLLLGLTLNKLADLLISAKTTLPALLISLGAPVWMLGWLVPIRESGALLPQAIIGRLLKQYAARHIPWRLGMCVQVLSVAAMSVTATVLTGYWAGFLLLLLLAALSLGRALCSLTFKDIEADKVKKGKRGQLIGSASVAAGFITVLVAVPLVYQQSQLSGHVLLVIMCIAALSLLIALIVMLPLNTFVAKDDDRPPRETTLRAAFYRFVIVRSMFVHSALVAPYFMLQSEADATELLPFFLTAQAIASVVSSRIWGRLSDDSARRTLQIAGLLAVVACVGVLVISARENLWMGALFFLLSVAHAGIRTARKTYPLDIAKGQERTEFIAYSNTVIGIVLLVLGAVYSALSSWLTFSVVYIMAAMLIIGVLLSFLLPNEKEST